MSWDHLEQTPEERRRSPRRSRSRSRISRLRAALWRSSTRLEPIPEERPYMLPHLRVRREIPTYRVPFVLRHLSGQFTSRTPEVLEESLNSEIKIRRSTSYHGLYEIMQFRAALLAGVKPRDISGAMYVICWGEDHPILWDKWVSETQYMLGIEGAKLKFEYHVISQSHVGQRKGLDLRRVRTWVIELFSCAGRKRRDSGVDLEETEAWEFAAMDDLARAHAVVPAPMV